MSVHFASDLATQEFSLRSLGRRVATDVGSLENFIHDHANIVLTEQCEDREEREERLPISGVRRKCDLSVRGYRLVQDFGVSRLLLTKVRPIKFVTAIRAVETHHGQ